MEFIVYILNAIDGLLGSAQYFPYLLLGTGIFFTIYLKFPQIRYFNQAWRIVRGKYDNPDHEGDATHFQALTTAISGTVGTGNIGGVALAIYLGGPAALFWMWMTAFVGMTTKFVEVTLSHKYRVKDEKGFIVGGPMHVMERRLNMKWLAVFFAAATVISSFGSGNLPQSNNIANGINASFGVPEYVTGGILSICLGLVLIGGIKRIVLVAESIVPTMALIYLIGALAVIIPNFDQVIVSFVNVFRDAFSGSAATGGFLGASFAYAFNRGVNRGLFSNEAGQGSAPIAHAAAKADEPVSEGMVSILEPFIDTIIICTLTGLVILSSGVWTEKFDNEFQPFDMEFVAGHYSESNEVQREDLFRHLSFDFQDDPIQPFSGEIKVAQGVALTSGFTVIHNRSVAEKIKYYAEGIEGTDGTSVQLFSGSLKVEQGELINEDITMRGYSLVHSVDLTARAFTRGWFGDFGQYIVTIGLVLFAFSTAVAWSYYGDRSMTYLFGIKSVMPYRIAYVAGFFIASIADTSLVWLISAITLALMTIPNLFASLMLYKEMKSTIADYWKKFNEEHPDG